MGSEADAADGGPAGGDRGDASEPAQGRDDGYGRLLVERTGGIGGMLLVWEVDIDASSRREDLGRTVAELPWSQAESGAPPLAGADRFAYFIESRYGSVRFGEGQMPQEWQRLIDEVREVTEPQRRRPG
jgi:hypothetical protein